MAHPLPLLLGLLLTAAPPLEEGHVQVREDDVPLAQALDAGDAGWQSVPFGRVVAKGPTWVRMQVQVPPRAPGAPPPALGVASLGAWEAWWDGAPLGRNGTPAVRPEEEVPGRVDVVLPLPEGAATPGPHVLTLRLSAHHLGFDAVGLLHDVSIGEASRLARARLLRLLPALCTLGALVLMGLHLGVRAASRRARGRTAGLLLSAACLLSAALLLLEAWRGIAVYPYPVHAWRLRGVVAASLLVALLLPAALAASLGALRWRWAVGLGAGGLLLALAMPSADGKAVVALGLSLLASLVLVGRAAGRRVPGARALLAGVLFATALYAADVGGFPERGFFVAFGVLLTCASAVHGFRVRRQEEQLEAATRTSERLQLELLSRSLQPHFLMNTLAALTETVETAPREAVRFIDALGGVYRLLLGMADARTVPLARELELCRAYLQLMGFRQGVPFSLEVRGRVDADAPVPPALFHTLLENAFSHQRYVRAATFLLEAEAADGRRRYRLVAPAGEGPPRTAAVGEGTGMRYVEARLEEAFPRAWRLEGGPSAGGWETRVEVHG